MKKKLMSLVLFATFSTPENFEYIELLLNNTHLHFSKAIPAWSIQASKRKLITYYWYSHVLPHFISLLVLSTLIMLMIDFSAFHILPILLTGILSWPILIFCLYGPLFYSDFLLKLDTAISIYEGDHIKALKKCQQKQMSNLALAIIYYSFAKGLNLSIGNINHKYGEILMVLFGKYPDDMQKNLKMLTCRISNVSTHKITEIEKSIKEVQEFFSSIEYNNGLEILEQLDRKFKKL
ncbi:hypothetical protein [Chitinophaga sp.]|uniref:hypothetical protein n=1 Tax=Chitinophaga sp. TaxID=1869181 RepID=UPI0031DA8FC1